MDYFSTISSWLASCFWNLYLVFFIVGCGLLFTIYLQFPQIRLFYHALRVIVGKYIHPRQRIRGELSSFRAFCNAISTPIGLGSIAGVSIAITTGGPGAVFWMWMAGLVGMATKLVSISAAMLYHEEDKKENIIYKIGPMYTIKNGLKKNLSWLATIFSLLTILASFGAGNLFQSNQIAKLLRMGLDLPEYISGIIIASIAFFALIKKSKIPANLVSKFAPFFVMAYTIGAAWIIFLNFEQTMAIISSIITNALYPSSVVGGIVGITSKEVIIIGMRRALFSNEAGLGSSAMAQRYSISHPIQEGIIGMLGPFIDTIIVSTITALIILMTNVWNQDGTMQGIELTAKAFVETFGTAGIYFITLFVLLFAFSTMLTWAYYGEKAFRFIFVNINPNYYNYLFIALIIVGAMLRLDIIINLTDIVIGLMVIPNLITNLLMMKEVKLKLKKYKIDLKAERI